MNICLVSANNVIEHFAFLGNIDFTADDQGALCITHERLLCLFTVREKMFTIGESATVGSEWDGQISQ